MMRSYSFFFSSLLICFLLYSKQIRASEEIHPVSRQTCLNSETEQSFRDTLDSKLRREKALIPGFVRAAFHDCITATASNSNSGCNESLRLRAELRNSDNARLRRTINAIRDTRRESGACISFADGIQIGTEIALAIAGDVDIEGKLADLDNPREDADSPDASTDELSNELPSRNASFATLGLFTAERDSRQERWLYHCNALIALIASRICLAFNTLQSDEAMISTVKGKNWIKYYAGQIDDGDEYDEDLGLSRTITDFGKFMIKLSQMSSDDVES
ncbi:Peroxidase [Gracilaria domingensis]|nr:Peroxidase [Gracilaria domingensis]